MRYPTRKVTLNIHGLEIKAQQRQYAPDSWSEYITIPRNIFRKVVALGPEKVRVVCRGIYTDDYAFDAAYNYQKGDVPLDCELFTSGWGIFDSRHASITAIVGARYGTGQIDFGWHSNEHYTLYPIDGAITLTVRDERSEVESEHE